MNIMELEGQETSLTQQHIAKGERHSLSWNPVSIAIKEHLESETDSNYQVYFYLLHEFMQIYKILYADVLRKPDYKSIGSVMSTTTLEDWLRDFDNNKAVQPVTLTFFKQENDLCDFDEEEIRDGAHIDDRLWIGIKNE